LTAEPELPTAAAAAAVEGVVRVCRTRSFPEEADAPLAAAVVNVVSGVDAASDYDIRSSCSSLSPWLPPSWPASASAVTVTVTVTVIRIALELADDDSAVVVAATVLAMLADPPPPPPWPLQGRQ
jgi:hypothetical protein